jgi:hypothetical protein
VTAAAAAVERLHERATGSFIRALPCIDAPARLLRLARECMEAGRYLQAAYLAGACRRQAEPLATAEPCTPAQARELAERLERMRALCVDTRVRGDEDEPGDGAFAAALALVRDGFAPLAARVADELDVALAARRQFHRELRRPGDGAAAPALAALRPHLGEPGEDGVWARATGLLWASRLAGGVRRMQSQHDRLKRLGARLAEGAAASPPGAAPPDSADRPNHPPRAAGGEQCPTT